jgi:ubiquinone/menaquinone biosynthesis C-methylase UbiE
MPPRWTSYDDIAEVYGAVAERLYFAAPAQDLVSLLQLHDDAALLDVGTGSGVVASAALRAFRGAVFACDPAVSMLRIARRRLPSVRFVAAVLPQLPFRRHTFHAVTLGFVLSHISDLNEALIEVKRVLKVGGRVAFSSWSVSPAGTTPGRVWEALTAELVAPGELQEAMTRALPSEEQLSSSEGLAMALRAAGFVDPQIEQRSYSIECRTDEYLQARLISLPARYMLAHLTHDEWERFVTKASETLPNHFGETLRFETAVNFARARKAG